MSLKKIILTLIACGLLSSFQASIIADYSLNESALLDSSSDSNKFESEKESGELEDSKLFALTAPNFELLQITLWLDNKGFTAPRQNLAQVPTSPPNA